ncbi:MAG: hypothetical protein WCL51_03330 [Bacteroidota bacterium]
MTIIKNMARYPGYDIFDGNSDKRLKELSEVLNNSSFITGEVLSANNGGFVIDYKGFPCFLPLSEATHKFEPDLNFSSFLNSFQKFKIKDIRNKTVILSRKAYLGELYDKLEAEELKNIKIGDKFKGKVKKVDGYGVYFFKEYSIGLLHISNIFDLDFESEKVINRKLTKHLLNEVFPKNAMINLIVEKVFDGKYGVIIDESSVESRLYITKIKEIVQSNPDYISIKQELERN